MSAEKLKLQDLGLQCQTPLSLKALVKALFHMFGLGSFGQFSTMAIVLH